MPLRPTNVKATFIDQSLTTSSKWLKWSTNKRRKMTTFIQTKTRDSEISIEQDT